LEMLEARKKYYLSLIKQQLNEILALKKDMSQFEQDWQEEKL